MNNKDFSQIYERNYRRSFLFAKSYVHDDMVAEDIAVESLFKYWQVLKEDIATNVDKTTDSLLVTIIKNKAIDYLRREIVRQSALDDISEWSSRDLEIRISSLESCNPTELFSSEIQEIIRQTLEELPVSTRRVFELSRFENKSVKEIAEIMNLSTKTVEYHITKSLKAMRVALKDYLPLLIFFIYFNK